ncbi:MAG: hypothetical protein WBL28_07985, partial [Methylotenera sp.]
MTDIVDNMVEGLKMFEYGMLKGRETSVASDGDKTMLEKMAADYLNLSPQDAINQNLVSVRVYVAEAVLRDHG